MIRIYAIFGIVAFAVWVFTLIQVLSTPEGAVRNLPKVAWVVIVLLFPALGTVGWYIFGAPENRGPRRLSAHERAQPSYPEYDRPGRAAAVDPAKDEEFLRQVRERAEEQRRRYHEQQKREQQRPEAMEPEAPAE